MSTPRACAPILALLTLRLSLALLSLCFCPYACRLCCRLCSYSSQFVIPPPSPSRREAARPPAARPSPLPFTMSAAAKARHSGPSASPTDTPAAKRARRIAAVTPGDDDDVEIQEETVELYEATLLHRDATNSIYNMHCLLPFVLHTVLLAASPKVRRTPPDPPPPWYHRPSIL